MNLLDTPRNITIVRTDGKKTWSVKLIGKDQFDNPKTDNINATALEMADMVICGLMKASEIPQEAAAEILDEMMRANARNIKLAEVLAAR